MISVVTLTYKRGHLLEEAIESFLQQDQADCEMVIINDDVDVKYTCKDSRIKIYNLAKRYTSIISKLQLGFFLATNKYMFRLDDDDLLSEHCLRDAKNAIKENPGYDIYRSKNHYYFVNNIFNCISSNINNGNIYTKDFISKLEWTDPGIAEDVWLTFECGGSIYEYSDISMLYRWGMSTYHISGLGNYYVDPEDALKSLSALDTKKGKIKLKPNFANNYYEQVSQNNSI